MVVPPVMYASILTWPRSTGDPSTVIPPGWASTLLANMSRNWPCSAAGRFVLSAFQARMSNGAGFLPIR